MAELFSFTLIEQLGWPAICLICFVALITSSVHGATGVAGGFLLSAAIAPIIGVKPIVPVISVALLISHTTRALLNYHDFDKRAFLYIALPATPFIIGVAFLYGKMSASTIAIFLGLVILSSIPIRHWAKSKKVKVGKLGLNSIGVVYGSLSGASIGPGMLLVPFMLGYGLTERLPACAGRIDVVFQVLKYNIFCNCSIGGGKVAPAPKPLPPLALLQHRELSLY